MSNHELTMNVGGIPPGMYPAAEFIGTEDFENGFGNAIKLKWRILSGEHSGSEATRICSPSLSAKNALGKLAVGLKGGPIAIGERFRFADYVGVRGALIVEPTQTGGGRVATFLRQQAAPQGYNPPPPVAPPPVMPSLSTPAMTAEQLTMFAQFMASQQVKPTPTEVATEGVERF